MFVKKSKFFGVIYSDEISELQFFGKELSISVAGEVMDLQFKLMRGLDGLRIRLQLQNFNCLEFQDDYIVKQFSNVLNAYPQVKYFKLKLNDQAYKVTYIKVNIRGLVLSLA
ncbi:hypothetical protein N9901_02190 [Flavobacteriaceae bacterium]|nr:hypothetical protein [Flavobacteriaceae bacterium]